VKNSTKVRYGAGAGNWAQRGGFGETKGRDQRGKDDKQDEVYAAIY